MLTATRIALIVLLLSFWWDECVSELKNIKLHPTHGVDRVRLLRVNESVHPLQSDLLFSWESCGLCDGYEATLELTNNNKQQIVPYLLKGGVTSLNVTALLPRTRYRFKIKSASSNSIRHTEISGLTFSAPAPPPVEGLTVSALTNNSLKVKWKSQMADGFMFRVLNQNVSVRELNLLFAQTVEQIVRGLEPATQYEIRVDAYFKPENKGSTSPSVTVHGKTLPSELPNIELRWEVEDEEVLKILWTNPKWPYPIAHNLICYKHDNEQQVIFNVSLAGFSEILGTDWSRHKEFDADCTLTSRFSSDKRSTKSYKLRIPKQKDESNSYRQTYTDYGYVDSNQFTVDIPQHSYRSLNGFDSEALYISFSGQTPKCERHMSNVTFEYTLCKNENSCPKWKGILASMVSEENLEYVEFPLYWQAELQLGPGMVTPWTSYVLKYRLLAGSSYYSSRSYEFYSPIGFIEIPPIHGTVPPVKELAIISNRSVVSWQYTDLLDVDYFLLTHCQESRTDNRTVQATCSSFALPAANRSMVLSSREENCLHSVSVQAGKVHRGRAILSTAQTSSFFLPSQKTNGFAKINLKTVEIANSSIVRVDIDYEANGELPEVVEFHVRVCGRQLRIVNEEALDQITSFDNVTVAAASETCENSTVLPVNTTLELLRRPWTEYSVIVNACYGLFDSEEAGNITLPLYKAAPGALSGLEWDDDQGVVNWKYRHSFLPSGFRLSFCGGRLQLVNCTVVETGPLNRSYHGKSRIAAFEGDLTLFVSAFVRFEDTLIEGPRSELLIASQQMPIIG